MLLGDWINANRLVCLVDWLISFFELHSSLSGLFDVVGGPHFVLEEFLPR